jgi:hypothetical protein
MQNTCTYSSQLPNTLGKDFNQDVDVHITRTIIEGVTALGDGFCACIRFFFCDEFIQAPATITHDGISCTCTGSAVPYFKVFGELFKVYKCNVM